MIRGRKKVRKVDRLSGTKERARQIKRPEVRSAVRDRSHFQNGDT